MLFADQLKQIDAIEQGFIVKFGLTLKMVVDYIRDQLAGGSIELILFGRKIAALNFNFPSVQKATPAE